jgi:protein SCO1/2
LELAVLRVICCKINDHTYQVDNQALLIIIAFISFLSFFATGISSAQVADYKPAELQKAYIDEHPAQKIPLDLKFTNDAGQEETVGQYFHKGKPVIIVLAYYSCPMLCTFVLNGVATGLRQLDWTAGKEFQVLTISIDTLENFEQAAAKKATLIQGINRPGIEDGWRFFVGRGKQVAMLADALGFHYYYDNDQKMYAHPTAIFVLTEDGIISRYLYGIEYNKQDLRLALLEASQGKIGNTLDRLLLYCYHYDPNAKGYVLFAENLMKLGGLMTVFIVVIVLGVFWTRERTKRSESPLAVTKL